MHPETVRNQAEISKVARYRERKRVDEQGMGDREGPPGLGHSGDRYHTSALDSECAPLLLRGTPGFTEERVAPQRVAAKERQRVPDSFPEGTMEAEGQQPMSLDSSTEVPGSLPVSIRLPFSPLPFDKNCAPTLAPTMDSRRLDHLPYDQFHDL